MKQDRRAAQSKEEPLWEKSMHYRINSVSLFYLHVCIHSLIVLVVCLRFTHTHTPSRDIETSLIYSAASIFFVCVVFFPFGIFVSKLNNKSEKGRGICLWFCFISFGFACPLSLIRSHHNRTNEEWTENNTHLFTNLVKMSLSIFCTNEEQNKNEKILNEFFDCMGSCRICFMSFFIRFHCCCFFSYCSLSHSLFLLEFEFWNWNAVGMFIW